MFGETASRRPLETMIADGAGDAAAPVVIRLMEKFALLCEYDDGSKRRSDEDLPVPAVLPRDIREVPARWSSQPPRRQSSCTAAPSIGFIRRACGSASCAGASSTPRRGHCARPPRLSVGSVALRGDLV